MTPKIRCSIFKGHLLLPMDTAFLTCLAATGVVEAEVEVTAAATCLHDAIAPNSPLVVLITTVPLLQ